MGIGYNKSNENMYFRGRKEAAIHNARLQSRNGAAEILGVSPSTLADYELGLTKVVPVDKVVLMADLYGCPEFKNRYCKCECPIGKTMPIATEIKSIEGAALRFVREFDNDRIRELVKDVAVIASDGVLTDAKKEDLREILKKMDRLAETISEVKLVGEKTLKG